MELKDSLYREVRVVMMMTVEGGRTKLIVSIGKLEAVEGHMVAVKVTGMQAMNDPIDICEPARLVWFNTMAASFISITVIHHQ